MITEGVYPLQGSQRLSLSRKGAHFYCSVPPRLTNETTEFSKIPKRGLPFSARIRGAGGADDTSTHGEVSLSTQQNLTQGDREDYYLLLSTVS